MEIIAIERGTIYSPNHIGNDKKILDLTVNALRELSYNVVSYTEDEFLQKDVTSDVIISMARDKKTIAKLKKLEDNGALVINSAYGIENCTRRTMTELLLQNSIPHPESVIFDIDEISIEEIEALPSSSYWIKRGDFHAIHREDVSYARSIDEVVSIIEEFRYRNIPDVVINEHLDGDLVKFYGVADTDFFYWFYPYDMKHSKFGLEKINGQAKEIPFSQDDLKMTCDRAGEILNVKVYGGDCIIDTNGNFKIIDFNDWPSFAPCRMEAGKKIAECIDKQIRKNDR